MIRVSNVNVLKLKDQLIKGELVKASDIHAALQNNVLWNIPVVLKMGKAEHVIGAIHQARIGRDDVFVDTVLELEAALELDITVKEGSVPGTKNISIIPVKLVYTKEVRG